MFKSSVAPRLECSTRGYDRSVSAPAEQETDVPWLSDEQQQAWRALAALFTTVPAALDAQLRRDAGLNGFEYQVLAALSEAPDRAVVLTDLAEAAQGSLSRLSHAVTRLEKAGLVERRTCPGAGSRRTEARLTDAGWTRIQQVAPGHVREVRRLVVDALTPEQLLALGEAARLVTAAARARVAEVCTGADAC